jgi:hypothetical protein
VGYDAPGHDADRLFRPQGGYPGRAGGNFSANFQRDRPRRRPGQISAAESKAVPG